MARKPKTQPSPDAAAAAPVLEPTILNEASIPARRGRKSKAATLLFASPAVAEVGRPAPDDAGADALKAAPIKTPGRNGPGRKPKSAAGAEAAPSIPGGTVELRDQAPREKQAKADPDLTKADAPVAAAVPRAKAATGSDPARPGRDPGRSASKTARSVPEADASASAKPAAHWDRTTDRVQFDWPTIERVAAQGGPHQGMAKLLVAARAEGAGSRWPF